MCDDFSESITTSETSSNISCDTSIEISSETASEFPENTGDLSNDGSDQLSDEESVDVGDVENDVQDISEEDLFDTNENIEDGSIDLRNDNVGDSSVDCIDDISNDDVGKLYEDGSNDLPDGTFDSQIFDDSGNLRVMDNEEYLSLSREQQELFEQKYNTMSQEEKDAYDKQFAQAELENYNKHVNRGDYDRYADTERDLKDIIDGKYQSDDDLDSNVTEYCAKGAMSAVGASLGVDPITKADLTRQAADIGRIYGPNAMENITRTAYMQNGVHIPTPIVHEDEYGNKVYDYGQDNLFVEFGDENSEIKELKSEYADDLINRSEYPETIDKTILDAQWNKIPPEQNEIMREEYSNCKNELIKQWEDVNGCHWPSYDKDVYSQGGKLIRRAGDKYDAHHIQPLTFGGNNVSNNLTPLHALEHYDKQGIHAPNSAFGRMEKYYKGDQT